MDEMMLEVQVRRQELVLINVYGFNKRNSNRSYVFYYI